jgi:hypothetical protein
MSQLDYTEEKVALVKGQISRSAAFRHLTTGVIPTTGRPKIVTFTFAGTWAAGDTETITLDGVPSLTTLAAGEDSIEEARDAVLSDLLLVAQFSRDYTFAAVSTDAIRVTGKERVEGSGEYVDYTATESETTAGDGAVTQATTQTWQDKGDIAFGTGLALVTTDDGGQVCALPSATGFAFAGVAVFEHAQENRLLLGEDGIPAQQAISLMLKGYVGLEVEETVVPGDPVFLRHTANANGSPGGWRMSADTATADQITGARWVTGAAAGELAEAFFG